MTKRMYLQQNVFDAALDRIRWLYDEFNNIYVNFSGGKDSVVILNLALKVAKEKNRLPVPVLFVDQEAEWQSTIDLVEQVMTDTRVEPHWLQVPLRLFNATSTQDQWLHCWHPEQEEHWVRPKHPISIKENHFGTDRFAELLDAYVRYKHKDEPAINLTGVRTEESPSRLLGLTVYETYKGETWGAKRSGKNKYNFHPIYDWSYTDVWKAIHDHDWPYNKIYDAQYQYGVPIRKMRVSNVHHETAVNTLHYLQELEHDTWERIVQRVQGVNTVKHLKEDFSAPKELPYMFNTWREYRDHLLENLITDPKQKDLYKKQFAQSENMYQPHVIPSLIKTHIAMLIVNDYHGTKLTNFAASNFDSIKNRGSQNAKH